MNVAIYRDPVLDHFAVELAQIWDRPRLEIFSAFRIRWENWKIPTTARVIARNVKARHGTPLMRLWRAFTFWAITWAVVGIFQFSQWILKAEIISNLETALRFELAPLQSDLKRVCDISRRSRYNTPGWTFRFINFEKHRFRHPYSHPINPTFLKFGSCGSF